MDNSQAIEAPVTEEPQVDVTADQSTPVADTTALKAPAAKDYSFVPSKFLKDGEPDFEQMAKSYVNLEKKIGKKGTFAPDSADEYQYTPTSIQLDDQTSTAFKEEAHKMGISKQQYEWMMTKYEEAYTQTSETPEKAEGALKQMWGDNFDTNIRLASKAMDYYIPSDIPIEAIGNNPYVIAILARIGSEMQEDTTPSASSSAAVGVTHDDIKAIMKSPDYWKDKAKQKQVSDWYAKNR